METYILNDISVFEDCSSRRVDEIDIESDGLK